MGNDFCTGVATFHNASQRDSRGEKRCGLRQQESKSVESSGANVLPTLVPFDMATVHRLRKPVASTAMLSRRNKVLGAGILLALGVAGGLAYLLAGCGGGSSTAPPAPPPPPAFQALTATEVTS